MEEERERLFKIDSIEVLDYIKQSVEILMNMKGDEYDQFVRNRELQNRLKAKEEKKLEALGSSGHVKDHAAADNDHGRNRFILSSSMLSGSSMAMSIDSRFNNRGDGVLM